MNSSPVPSIQDDPIIMCRGLRKVYGDLQAVYTHQAPTIDGDLSDAVWSAAPVCTTFTQREPIEGATPSQRTQIRVLFDDGYLYFAIRNHDTDPARMLTTHMRRDDRLFEDDSIHIILDTYNNRRGGYHFGTNSLGAQQDALLLDEGRSRNEAWDAVWESRARRDSLGWSVEIAIPFGQLRYDEGGEGIWGINVGRRLPRDNEEVYLEPPPQSFGFDGGFRTSRLASLRGLIGLKRRTQLEVTPYLLPGTRREFDGLDPDEDPFEEAAQRVEYTGGPPIHACAITVKLIQHVELLNRADHGNRAEISVGSQRLVGRIALFTAVEGYESLRRPNKNQP